jgi:hypothetical protein
MTWGTGNPWIDIPLLCVGAFYLGKAAGYMVLGTIAFVRWRWHDRKDHAGFRK